MDSIAFAKFLEKDKKMVEDTIINNFRMYNIYLRDVIDNVPKELYQELLMRWNFAHHKVKELRKKILKELLP